MTNIHLKVYLKILLTLLQRNNHLFSKMVEVAEDGKFDLACEKEKRLSGIKSQSQSLSDINL